MFKNKKFTVTNNIAIYSSLLIILFSVVPTQIPGYSNFVSTLDLIIIYYFRFNSPRLMPIWLVFIIGLYRDITFGTPLGLYSVFYILFHFMIFYSREIFIRENFSFIWSNFTILCLINLFVQWLTVSFIFDRFIGITNIIFYFIISVFSYPIMHGLLDKLNSGNKDELADA